MSTLDGIDIVSRTISGQWVTIRGTVHGRLVSVDIPKSRLDGLSEMAEAEQMKRALRAGLPYARS